MSTALKVVVFGNATYPSDVTVVRWAAVPEDLNIIDYDAVVMDLASSDLKSPHEHLPNTDALARLLLSRNRKLVLVGDPRKQIQNVTSSHVTTIQSRLPVTVEIVGERGTGIDVECDDYSSYFELVDEWQFFTVGPAAETPKGVKAAKKLNRGIKSIGGEVERIAVTGAHQPLAWACRMTVSGSPLPSPSIGPGEIVVLPAPTISGSGRAITVLLRDHFGLGARSERPAWVDALQLPKEKELRTAVEETKKRIAELEDTLLAQRDQVDRESRFGNLLYEQGEPLEAIVLEVMEMFGATLDPPSAPNKEDGRIRDPSGRRYVLEVKGLGGSAAVKNVRQAAHWVVDAEAEAEGGWGGNGVVVVNPFRTTDLGAREDPFPENVLRTAETMDIRLVLTPDLHEALRLHQRGEFDPSTFWDALAAGPGYVDFLGSEDNG